MELVSAATGGGDTGRHDRDHHDGRQLPAIFLLTGRDHKLFAPLAWTKTFALIASLIVAVTVVFVLGAWVGLPTVLAPFEKLAAVFGADLNEVPGYVDAKHTFTGLTTDDWIALDEGSWFYMPSLYPGRQFLAGHAGAADTRRHDRANSGSAGCARQDRPH